MSPIVETYSSKLALNFSSSNIPCPPLYMEFLLPGTFRNFYKPVPKISDCGRFGLREPTLIFFTKWR